MRRTRTCAARTCAALAAGAALTAAGAVHAQDAQSSAATDGSTTRGSVLLPVGDKVHGHLRGGETHALQVHLAKGDVYSFSVTSQKRGDALLMHLTMLDPSGNEVNSDARVDHIAYGKRVTVGPYVAPASGTYVMELSAQSWFEGDYWGTSSVRGGRTTIVRLPGSGKLVSVDVAAGSTIRLRPGSITSFVMATPNGQPNSVASDAALVKSLRAGGLASGETGTYEFGATGVRGPAAVLVTKPQWTAATVDLPPLPGDPTGAGQFDFVNKAWKAIAPQPQTAVAAQNMAQPAPTTTAVGAPVPVSATASSTDTSAAATVSLFLGADVAAVGDIASHLHVAMPSDTSDPGTATPTQDPSALPFDASRAQPADASSAPPDTTSGSATPADAPARTVILVPQFTSELGTQQPVPHTPAGTSPTAAGTPVWPGTFPLIPSVDCDKWVCGPMLLVDEWRDAPWAWVPRLYPGSVSGFVMPREQSFRTGSFGPALGWDAGAIVIARRYFVDGHAVDGLLATGGESSIQWTCSGTLAGSGFTGQWTIDGEWTMEMHAGGLVRSCSLRGSERATCGGVNESLVIENLDVDRTSGSFYPVGTIKNVLEAPAAGISQTVVHTFGEPISDAAGDHSTPIQLTIVTVDPSTSESGDEADVELTLRQC